MDVCFPQQGIYISGVAAIDKEGASGTTRAHISDAGTDAFETAGDRNDGLGHSAVQPCQNNGQEEERQTAAAAAALSSPVIEGGGHGVSGGLGGTVVENFRGECGGGEEESSSSSNLSNVPATTNSADSMATDHDCVHCATSCWFACSCACHAVLAENSSVAAETEEGGHAARRRAPTNELFRRKRQRNGREQPQAGSSNQKEGESARDVPAVLDVERAFLATSESGGGPRSIRFGTAARYPRQLFGRRGGGDEVFGVGISYDTRWVG